MNKKNLLFLAAFIMLSISIGFASAIPLFIGSPIINNTDSFYSPYETINFSVYTASSGGPGIENVTSVRINLTDINSTACNGGYLNLTNVTSLGQAVVTWTGGCNVNTFFNWSLTTPGELFNISLLSVIAYNETGAINITGIIPTGPIIGHNLGSPTMNGTQYPETCIRFGSDTINFSRALDFAHINFVIDTEANFSCLAQGQGPPGLPSTFKDVNLINITSINMSTQEQAMRLMQLPQAIQVRILPPKQFGHSRIYINSTWFSELNTTAIIKFFNLPFSSRPNIVEDTGAAGVNSSTVTWVSNGYSSAMGGATGNLTFTVFGFSGYNMTDTAVPLITINFPLTNIKNGENVNAMFNITVNGTRTEPSLITVSLNSSLTYVYNGSIGGANTANCVNISADSEVFNCIVVANLSDASYTLTVNAWDYGLGIAPGNTNSSSFSFIVDTSTPSVNLMTYPANGTYLNSSSITFVFNISDSGNANIDCNILIDENYSTLTVNSINMSTVVNTSIISGISDGLHNWTIECWDNGGANGNFNSTGTQWFTIDTTKPVPAFVSPAANANLSSKTILINTTVTETNLNYINISVYSGATLINSTTNTTSKSVNISLTVPADGSYAIYVIAADLAGNSNTTSRNVTVDTTVPVLTIYSPVSNATYYANQSILIQFSMSDLTPSRLWYMNDTGNSTTQAGTGLFSTTINFTSNGTHTFRFYGNDSLNNLAITAITFNVDSSVPANSTIVTNQTTIIINETITQLIVSYNSSLQNVTINSTFSNQLVSLNLSQIISSGNVTIPNQFTLVRESTTGINYTAVIPANTNISGGAGWNGELMLPMINTSAFTAPSGSANVIVDMGSSVELNFSNPVKIMLGGMAGKKAAWSRGSATLTAISTVCNSATAPTNINATTTRECYVDSTPDLVIWTYHFTSFAAYTASTTIPPDGGTTGGSSTTTTPDTTEASYSSRFTLVTAGLPAVVTPPSNVVTATGIKEVSVTTNVDLVNVDFTLSTYKEADVVSKLAGTYKYFSITVPQLSESYITSAEIKFEVAKSWFTDNNYDVSKVKLMRYKNGEWQSLETIATGESSEAYQFKATSPGFSIFAVVSEKKVIISNDNFTIPLTGKAASQTTTASTNPLQSKWIMLGALSVILLAIIAYLVIPRGHARFLPKQKNLNAKK